MSDKDFMQESTQYISIHTGRQLLWDRVDESLKEGVDGLVTGGTYKEGEEYFAEFERYLDMTKKSGCLYLVPGIGTQGGDPEIFLKLMREKGIDAKRCMLSSSRGLMFAENRGEAARKLKNVYQDVTSYESRKEFDRTKWDPKIK